MSHFEEPEERFEPLHKYVLRLSAVGDVTVDGTENEDEQTLFLRVDREEIEWHDIDVHGREIVQRDVGKVEVPAPPRPWERVQPKSQTSILNF